MDRILYHGWMDGWVGMNYDLRCILGFLGDHGWMGEGYIQRDGDRSSIFYFTFTLHMAVMRITRLGYIT